ncbi:hypothetical protein GINT2_002099 [Glugoides intestinalis]
MEVDNTAPTANGKGEDSSFPSPAENITLRNMTKDSSPKLKNRVLINAIEKEDLSFISEFLLSDKRAESVSNLSKYQKCKMLQLLIELVNQPLRLEAIRCIYEIMTDTGNIDAFCRILVERSVDFNKLIFLKGKIDYLKYLQKPKIDDIIENEYIEKE